MVQPKIRKSTATGVFVTKDALVITTATKAGHETTSIDFDVGQVTTALSELLEAGKLPGRINCAIEPRHMFSLARAVSGRPKGDRYGGAGELLPARLNNLRGGVVSGFSTVKLPAGQHVLLVACPRPKAEELLAGLPGRRTTNLRLSSAPSALAAIAQEREARPKAWTSFLRIVPGTREGLVFLLHGDVPVAWRMIEGGEAGLGASCQAAVMSLLNHARDDLGIETIDGALLHIGDDVTGIGTQLSADLSIPVQPAAQMTIDAETTSLALARQGLRFPKDDADLFRELQPPGDLRQNFPYQTAAALWGLIALIGGGLYWESEMIFAQARDLEFRATETLDEVGIDPDEMEDELDDLKNEIGTAEAFIVKRVYWSQVLRELPELLPENLELTGLNGEDKIVYPTDTSMGRVFARLFVINGEIEIPEGMHNPPEAKLLGEALKGSSTITNAFREVRVDVKFHEYERSRATLTVTCRPPDLDG